MENVATQRLRSVRSTDSRVREDCDLLLLHGSVAVATCFNLITHSLLHSLGSVSQGLSAHSGHSVEWLPTSLDGWLSLVESPRYSCEYVSVCMSTGSFVAAKV